MSTQTFTTSGTWTCPGGVSSVVAQCWGAGGGPGGWQLTGGGYKVSGGGGGGGAYASKTIAVVPGVVYNVHVGNRGMGGGTFGVDGASGTPGGDTWFGATTLVLAVGGGGGWQASSTLYFEGGAGGNSLGCVGDTAHTGGSGGRGQLSLADGAGAGGGGSAGAASNGGDGGNAAGAIGAAPGAAPFDGGAGGAGGSDVAGTGGNGNEPGGGGGSSAYGSTGSVRPGSGQVILTWTAVSVPVARPAMIVRREETPHEAEVSAMRRVLRIFNPTLAPAFSKPRARGVLVVREVAPPPVLPRPFFTLLAPQIATLTPAGPSIPRGTMIVRPLVHELERVTAATAQFIRPQLALIDTGTRYGSARAVYRIFAPAVYRFYRSNTATPPQPGDTPYATSATLPNQPATLFADGTWLISVSYFNGVIDSGFYPIGPRGETYVTLTITGGAGQPTLPGAPMGARLEVRAGGIIRVIAYYLSIADGANAADTWGIAYTTNGTTPPSGAASITQAMTAGPLQVLSYDLPAQADGTVVKVQLQTIRSTGTVYSTPGAVLQATAVANGPTGPLGIQDWPGFIPEDLA